jgi:hypothetical protein
LLPSPDLKPAYDKVVWLYVFRDFSGSPADLAAERVSLRLGMTAYPQHLLVDPASMEILADTGRSVESFLAAVGRAKAAKGEGAATRIREAEERAAALEKSGSVAAARKALADEDIVVRYRAIRILSEKEPKAVAADAEALLATPNDPFRFEVCRALKKAGDVQASGALERLLAEPKQSLNPNVLRIEASGALSACGDAASLKAPPPTGGTASPALPWMRSPRSGSARRRGGPRRMRSSRRTRSPRRIRPRRAAPKRSRSASTPRSPRSPGRRWTSPRRTTRRPGRSS